MTKRRKTVYIVCICLFAAVVVLAAFFLGGFGTDAGGSGADASGFPVYISELMSSNGSYYDDHGNTADWIELHNRSDIPIDLTSYKLTDNERTVRYVFPAGARIEPDGYYVVYCERNAGADYADFSIAKAGGEPIVLMNSRSVIIDRVVTLPLSQDQVMSRKEDGGWETLDIGTPGFENSEAGYAAYCDARRGNAAVRINELMSSNESYCGPSGVAADWVELFNASGAPVSLAGFRLTDRANATGYIFPDGAVIGAGEYLLLYCNGDVSDGVSAPFSLASAGGESLTLSTGAGIVLDQLITPPLKRDVSYARTADGGWQTSLRPTPGHENSEAGYAAYLASVSGVGAALRITELMASNTSCIMDAYGGFSDWIELHNAGDEALSLLGYCLSDNPDNPSKWALPDIELPAGARLVVFASGRDALTDGEPHTNFSLNRHRGEVLLRAPSGQLLSRVSYEALEDDMSYALDEASGQWRTSGYATPGESNDDAGYERFMATLTVSGPLAIAEVMVGNDTLLDQGHNQYYDWVELVNLSDGSVDISDYSLSDNLDKAARAALPAKVLKPGERQVLMCTNMELRRSTHPQISLSLNAKNEHLYLLDASGAVVDRLWLADVPYRGSCGRMPAQNGRFYFATPTPGKENQDGRRMISAKPVSSMASGVYESAEPLKIALSAEGAVHYTLDGNTPTQESPVYDGPLSVSETTVLRAAAFESGKLMSDVVTLNYIVNEGHSLPVVAVTTDAKYLYDKKLGILAGVNLFDRSVERPAHIEYFNGSEYFGTDCGIKLHGAGSRERLEKKSFKITFRGRYGGVAPLEFPLFEDNDTTTFHSILIRNSQDYTRGYVRDEITTWIAYRSTEELCVQDTRYCILYLNGAYHGLYCIKEAYSSGYFSVHYGVEKESVELQRGYIHESDPFQDVLVYSQMYDLRQPAHYQYIADRVNLESLIDWCIYEAYSANTDLSINARYIRSPEYDDNRWHLALFDLDCGFSNPATFDYIISTNWHGALFRGLRHNKDFQDMFLKRMAYQLENHLTQEAVLARYNYLIGQIESEMPREIARWHTKKTLNWTGHKKKLLDNIMQDREQQMKQSAANAFNIPLSEVEAYFTQP